jgi:hypothetical protein
LSVTQLSFMSGSVTVEAPTSTAWGAGPLPQLLIAAVPKLFWCVLTSDTPPVDEATIPKARTQGDIRTVEVLTPTRVDMDHIVDLAERARLDSGSRL